MSEQPQYTGPFKTGFDPRRSLGGNTRQVIYRGMTLAELAQQHTSECIRVLAAITSNFDPEDEQGETRKVFATSSRIKAITLLLAYGHGKPVDTLKIQETTRKQQGVQALSNHALEQLITQSTQDVPEQALTEQ